MLRFGSIVKAPQGATYLNLVYAYSSTTKLHEPFQIGDISVLVLCRFLLENPCQYCSWKTLDWSGEGAGFSARVQQITSCQLYPQ